MEQLKGLASFSPTNVKLSLKLSWCYTPYGLPRLKQRDGRDARSLIDDAVRYLAAETAIS